MKVAIYCRVSTRDKGQETANQSEAFKAMFAAASRREWDGLLFWSLDRFSREGAFPTLRYLTRLSELGVSYRSYTEEYINSTGVFGDVIVSLLATLAKQETIRLSERTIAGLERARAQGRVGGRPRVECDCGKVLNLHRAGKSLSAIAKELGVSKSSIFRIIQRPA